MTMKRIACSGIGVALFLGLTGVLAVAQNQAPATSQSSSSGSSLGDYARQVRKDPGGTSKPKVFDNDNLPKADKLSVIGQAPAPASNNAADAKAEQADSKNEKSGTEAKSAEKAPLTTPKKPEDENTKEAGAKQWADKITAQKDQIDLLGRELDVTQREYQIRAAAMYADAGNRMRNSADWDKQDAQYKQQIADKQKLEDLQEEARKAGAPASTRE